MYPAVWHDRHPRGLQSTGPKDDNTTKRATGYFASIRNKHLGTYGISIGWRDYVGHEILAAADGMVVLVKSGQLGGYHVRIYHGPDIDRGEIYTEYFHVYDPAVKRGDQIKRGQRMGSIEQPGFRRVSGTVHYHYLVVRGTEISPCLTASMIL